MVELVGNKCKFSVWSKKLWHVCWRQI